MTSTILTATLARFSPAAHEASAEAGANVEADLQRVLGGACSRSQLLAHCLDGAGGDRLEGWTDYVSAIFAQADAMRAVELDESARDAEDDAPRDYLITSRSTGAVLGTFPGATPADAIDAFCRDAGYRDAADAADVLSQTVDELVADLRVDEVRP